MKHTLVQEMVQHEPRLRRYASRLLQREPPVRRQAMAADLVQDTYVIAISKADYYQPTGSLASWLIRIMHNEFVNQVRKSVRQHTVPLPEGMDPAVPAAQTDRLVWRDFTRAMATLTDDQRKVIHLVGLDGLRYGEAAKVIGVKIGTLQSRLVRSRDRLREHMFGEP